MPHKQGTTPELPRQITPNASKLKTQYCNQIRPSVNVDELKKTACHTKRQSRSAAESKNQFAGRKLLKASTTPIWHDAKLRSKNPAT